MDIRFRAACTPASVRAARWMFTFVYPNLSEWSIYFKAEYAYRIIRVVLGDSTKFDQCIEDESFDGPLVILLSSLVQVKTLPIGLMVITRK